MRTAFILGAGFSKPAGLPLMNNFIHMAKDAYDFTSQMNEVISHVDRLIKQFANTGRYLNLDLDNIEELLSIFETMRLIENNKTNPFKRLICDLLNNLTPKFDDYDFGTYESQICSIYPNDQAANGYLSFICSVLGLEFELNSNQMLKESWIKIDDDVSVITFNYDLILESSIRGLARYGVDAGHIINVMKEKVIHLHGSIDDEESIMPPCWNKTMPEELIENWRLAYMKLKTAQRIVVIGYSFPITDSYFDYFMKFSLSQNMDLRRVTVIDPNSNDSFRDRLLNKFAKNKLRLINLSTEDIFSKIEMVRYNSRAFPIKFKNRYSELKKVYDAD